MLALTLDRGIGALTALGEDEAAVVFAGITLGALTGLAGLPAAEVPDRNAMLERLERDLGHARYAALSERGAAMTYEQVVEYAVAELDRLSSSE